DEKYASVIYATYVSAVWYLPLIGGWLADKILGARRAVLIGGIVIACGHYSMAINSMPTFYGGLILIACGTGLLKPNISAMVGQKPDKQQTRQDDSKSDTDFVTWGLGIVGGVTGAAVGYYYGDAGLLSALFPGVVFFWMGYLIGTARLLAGNELKRVLVIFILFVFSIVFWMTFEQAGSSLTL